MIEIPDFIKSNDLLMSELDQIIVLTSLLDYHIMIKELNRDSMDRCNIEIRDSNGRLKYGFIVTFVRGIFHEFEFLNYGVDTSYGGEMEEFIEVLCNLKLII